MSGAEAVRGLQERAARALPAEHITVADGWRLRYAPGCAWWLGTVLPHSVAGRGDIAQRIAGAEAFYAHHGATPRFQISPGACPEPRDAVLAQRGYLNRSPMSLHAAPTARVRARARPNSLRVDLDDRPTRSWLDTWLAVHTSGEDGNPRPEWDMLARVARPCAYASALIGDRVVAVGRAVVDTGWAGVFGMATLPGVLGRGAAGAVLAALAEWARGHRARMMYLQVERDNAPALRLYARAGFTEVGGYHYRIPG